MQKEKGEKERKKEEEKNGHGKHGKKKNRRYNYWTTSKYPCLVWETKQKRGKKSMKTTERKVKAEQ